MPYKNLFAPLLNRLAKKPCRKHYFGAALTKQPCKDCGYTSLRQIFDKTELTPYTPHWSDKL